MNDEDLSVNSVTEACGSGVWTRTAGGDLGPRRELQLGVIAVPELAILAEERFFQGFLLYSFL